MMYGSSGAALLTGGQNLVGAWWEAMGRVCLCGTLVLLCALLLMRMLRRIPAGVRCWIGRLAILKLYLLFVCFTVIAVPILPAKFEAATANFGSPTVGSSAQRSGRSVTDTPQFARMGAHPSFVTPLSASTGIAEVLGYVPPLLFGLWGIGVFCGLLRLFRQYREATTIVRSACPITDAAIQAEFLDVKSRLGLRCNPVLAVSDLAEVPMLFGFLRPTVVLPAALVAELAPDACRMILAHELAHVKRQDLLWSFLTGLALVPFFFHPLLWWTHRELRMVQEICCDEQAVQSVAVSPHAYGEVLVRVAASETASTHDGLISIAMAESFTTIQRRLEEMQRFRVSTGWRRWTPAVVVGVLGVALLPWQLKAQAQADSQAQQKAVPLVQSKEPQEKVGDYENIKVGVYGLHIIDAAIARPDSPQAFQGVFGTDTGVNQEFKANQFFLLDVTGRNQEELQLVKGVVKIRSKDDRGKALIAPGASTFLLTPSVQHLAKDTPLQIMLPFEMEDGAKSVKTLEGELVVVNAAVRTLTFTAAELQTGASKHVGAVSITLDGVHQTNGHFEIFATCTSVRFDPGAGPHIPNGPMGRNSDVRVEVMGTDNIPYNNVATGETVQPVRQAPPAAAAKAGAGSLNPKISQVKVIFGREETPRRPQTVTFHIVEYQGDTLHVPFKFTDIPLAEKH